MNPIELGKAIADVGVPVITAVMLILVVGLVWYLIRRQTTREDKHDKIQEEERLFYRTLVNNDLKSLHNDNLVNAELNRKSISMLKLLAEYFNKYFNGNNDKVNFMKRTKSKNNIEKNV